MPWCTFFTFDIIGDLTFDAPFGMVINGREECESALPGIPVSYISGVKSLNSVFLRSTMESGLLKAMRRKVILGGGYYKEEFTLEQSHSGGLSY